MPHNPVTTNAQDEALIHWNKWMTRRGRVLLQPVNNQFVKCKAVEAKILAGLQSAGVDEAVCARAGFAWHKERPFSVTILLGGSEEQMRLAKSYFQHALLPESGRHSTFNAQMERVAKSLNEHAVIGLNADNFSDMAKALGIKGRLHTLHSIEGERMQGQGR
jgi:hypothetical protein